MNRFDIPNIHCSRNIQKKTILSLFMHCRTSLKKKRKNQKAMDFRDKRIRKNIQLIFIAFIRNIIYMRE